MKIRGSTQILPGSVTSVECDSSIIITDGTHAFSGDQSMGGFKLTDLDDPIDAQDAATKAYVDANSGGGSPGGSPAGSIFGSLILLEEHIASASAALNFTTRNEPSQSGASIQSDFDNYVIDFIDILPATNAVSLQFEVSTNGGSSYDTGTNYASSYHRWSRTGQSQAGSASGSFVDIGGGLTLSNDATEQGLSGRLFFHNPGGTAGWKKFTGQFTWWYNGTPELLGAIIAAAYKSATAVNAFRARMSSGNIASGTMRLYGIAK